MRGWIRPVILSAAMIAAAPFGSAMAAGPAPTTDTAPQVPGTAAPTSSLAPKGSVKGSPLAQVAFPVQPFPLQDDGTYKEFLGNVANDVGRSCGGVESYGWEFPKSDQRAMDRIYNDTMDSFDKAGWKASRTKAKSIQDPETAAYLAKKGTRSLLVVWVPMRDSAMMMLCELSGAGKKN